MTSKSGQHPGTGGVCCNGNTRACHFSFEFVAIRRTSRGLLHSVSTVDLKGQTGCLSAIRSGVQLTTAFWNCCLAAVVAVILFEFVDKLLNNIITYCTSNIADDNDSDDAIISAPSLNSIDHSLLPSSSRDDSWLVVPPRSTLFVTSRDAPSTPLNRPAVTSHDGGGEHCGEHCSDVTVDRMTSEDRTHAFVHRGPYVPVMNRSRQNANDLSLFEQRPRVRFAPTVTARQPMTSFEPHSTASVDYDSVESNV